MGNNYGALILQINKEKLIEYIKEREGIDETESLKIHQNEMKCKLSVVNGDKKNISEEEFDELMQTSNETLEYKKRVKNRTSFLLSEIKKEKTWCILSMEDGEWVDESFIIMYYVLFLRELNLPIYYISYNDTSCSGEIYEFIYIDEIEKIIKKSLMEEFDEEEEFENLISIIEEKYKIPLSDVDNMFKKPMVEYSNHYIL